VYSGASHQILIHFKKVYGSGEKFKFLTEFDIITYLVVLIKTRLNELFIEMSVV
jgi:hypothetical protein